MQEEIISDNIEAEQAYHNFIEAMNKEQRIKNSIKDARHHLTLFNWLIEQAGEELNKTSKHIDYIPCHSKESILQDMQKMGKHIYLLARLARGTGILDDWIEILESEID